MTDPEKRKVGCLIFPGFELLDVFGPLEMYGLLPEHFDIEMIAESITAIESRQGPRCMSDQTFDSNCIYDILLIPGGHGVRSQQHNTKLLDWIRRCSESSEVTSSVCTGSVLLSRAGLLDGRAATTNKMVFESVRVDHKGINWRSRARWVQDGKFYTASGVSAGMDMTLRVIEDLLNSAEAERAAQQAEYCRVRDPNEDPFAELYGL